MKSITKWRDERRLQRERTAYENGYGWACTQVLLRGLVVEEVEMKLDSRRQADPFDRGAAQALLDIEQIVEKSELFDELVDVVKERMGERHD